MREQGIERPPHEEREGKAPEEPEKSKEMPERRLENADLRAKDEVSREKMLAKEKIADLLWEKPRNFVEKIIAAKLVEPLRRFLKYFGELDDEAMTSKALREKRDEARAAAGEREDA